MLQISPGESVDGADPQVAGINFDRFYLAVLGHVSELAVGLLALVLVGQEGAYAEFAADVDAVLMGFECVDAETLEV